MIIKGERLKRAILLALADTELQKIMDATLYQSKTVSQIIQESDVSHSTAYRKIRWLVVSHSTAYRKIRWLVEKSCL